MAHLLGGVRVVCLGIVQHQRHILPERVQVLVLPRVILGADSLDVHRLGDDLVVVRSLLEVDRVQEHLELACAISVKQEGHVRESSTSINNNRAG